MGLENKVQAAAPAQEKTLVEKAQAFEQRTLDVAKSVDGFVGDFVKAVPSSYLAMTVLPYALVNPIAGLAFASLAASSAYIATNVAYNLLTDVPRILYSTARHPINAIKSLINVIANPMKKLQMIASAPKSIFNYLVKGRNHNKYGKIVGNLIGGGLAAAYISPQLFSGAASAVNGITAPVGQGVSMFGEKAGAVMSTLSEIASSAKDTIVNNYSLHVQPSL
ncbi:MAG TPA: hypothetical protein VKE88_01405 [Candidatus Nanoarchaeia archaeon]|nr:hypothetical protein [Candidatus Nanoarchaeia archaeon]